MTARKENFTLSGERAATLASRFICLLPLLFSAQMCIESMQLSTPSQCLGAWQGPDIASTSIAVTLGHILSFAPLRHTTRPGQAWAPAQLPPYMLYTPGRRPILIFQRGWGTAEPLPHSLAPTVHYSMGITLQSLELGFQRGIQHKSLPCVIYCKHTYFFLTLLVKLFIKSSLIYFFSSKSDLILYAGELQPGTTRPEILFDYLC